MAQFYTLEEAARVLGMDADQLKIKAQRREVRAFLDSGSWRFRVSDIDEMARRTGMGSDPDLSLSDLDLPGGTDVPNPYDTSDENDELSEFHLGVARADLGAASVPEMPGQDQESGSDEDILLDDASLPMGGGSSSHIIGMESGGKLPSDSDVRLLPEDDDLPHGASDSDVQLSGEIDTVGVPPMGGSTPGDSDVTLVREESSDSIDVFPTNDFSNSDVDRGRRHRPEQRDDPPAEPARLLRTRSRPSPSR